MGKAPTPTNLLQFLRTSCTHRIKSQAGSKASVGSKHKLKSSRTTWKGNLNVELNRHMFGSCHVIWPKNIAINYKPSSFNFLHPSMDADSLIGDFPYFRIIVRPKCVDVALQPPSGCCQAGGFLLQASCLRSLVQHNRLAKFWCTGHTAWDKKLSLFKFCSSNGKFWFDMVWLHLGDHQSKNRIDSNIYPGRRPVIWNDLDVWCNMT